MLDGLFPSLSAHRQIPTRLNGRKSSGAMAVLRGTASGYRWRSPRSPGFTCGLSWTSGGATQCQPPDPLKWHIYNGERNKQAAGVRSRAVELPIAAVLFYGLLDPGPVKPLPDAVICLLNPQMQQVSVPQIEDLGYAGPGYPPGGATSFTAAPPPVEGGVAG